MNAYLYTLRSEEVIVLDSTIGQKIMTKGFGKGSAKEDQWVYEQLIISLYLTFSWKWFDYKNI